MSHKSPRKSTDPINHTLMLKKCSEENTNVKIFSINTEASLAGLFFKNCQFNNR